MTLICSRCNGSGWYIGAAPLPSGEPGEPYQVRCDEHCTECGQPFDEHHGYPNHQPWREQNDGEAAAEDATWH